MNAKCVSPMNAGTTQTINTAKIHGDKKMIPPAMLIVVTSCWISMPVDWIITSRSVPCTRARSILS